MKKLIMLCLLSFFFLHGSAFGSFNFIDNGNGTVTDARTGLVWLKNANPCGLKNWYDAGAYCSSLASGQAGLTDGSIAGQWRLPSKEELEGIGTDPPATWESGYPPVTWTMPGTPFTNVQSDYYWSGTSYPCNAYYAWVVNMHNGWRGPATVRTASLRLACSGTSRNNNDDNCYSANRTSQTIAPPTTTTSLPPAERVLYNYQRLDRHNATTVQAILFPVPVLAKMEKYNQVLHGQIQDLLTMLTIL